MVWMLNQEVEKSKAHLTKDVSSGRLIKKCPYIKAITKEKSSQEGHVY